MTSRKVFLILNCCFCTWEWHHLFKKQPHLISDLLIQNLWGWILEICIQVLLINTCLSDWFLFTSMQILEFTLLQSSPALQLPYRQMYLESTLERDAVFDKSQKACWHTFTLDEIPIPFSYSMKCFFYLHGRPTILGIITSFKSSFLVPYYLLPAGMAGSSSCSKRKAIVCQSIKH